MKYPPGPDPSFPELSEKETFFFPHPDTWKKGESVVATGGNLSPGMLLSAYEQGLFPWYGPEDPILWHSPDPRMIIFPEKLHISRSMRKVLEKGTYTVTFNKAFLAVIALCSIKTRHGQSNTWITKEMVAAYMELFNLGRAVSAEAYIDGKLAGGCYGVCVGNIFFGESMFFQRPNASKAAFLTLAQKLFSLGVKFIDCQVPSEHLRSLGGEEIRRRDYLELLNKTLHDFYKKPVINFPQKR